MGQDLSIPRPTTFCDASTAFSVQFSGSGNASWDGLWAGLMDSPADLVGGMLQPVAKAKAATFFHDPNGQLYSADLATMNYTDVQGYLWSQGCLLFTPSGTEHNDVLYDLTPVNISSSNTIEVYRNGYTLDYDFLIDRPDSCITTEVFGSVDDKTYTPVTLNVVKTGVCPGQQCKSLPVGSGPVPSTDTPAGFLALSDFETAAKGAITPDGYQKTFTNLRASNNANGYLGYTTLPRYDVTACSKRCNAISGCQAFNIYFERDPKVEPASGDYCRNPPSTTNIKCAFWGGPVTEDNAVNTGQWRKDFQIVIAGSNGYVNTAIAPIANYKSAAYYGNNIMAAPPTDCSSNKTDVVTQVYNDGKPFSAAVCAAACDALSAKARSDAAAAGNNNPVLCNYFNTFILNKGKTAMGQVCNMYSQTWKAGRATAKSQVDKDGNVFTFSSSYGFASANRVGSCGANA